MDKLKGVTVWMTGLSGAGKTTIAYAIYEELKSKGLPCYVADGDVMRAGLNSNLGFSREDRLESIRRLGEAALLFAKEGFVVLAPIISPYREARDAIRLRHQQEAVAFIEVYVATPLEYCESRDPKGLYKLARKGEINYFTGVSDVYEEPLFPEIILDTKDRTASESAAEVIGFLRKNLSLPC